MKPNENAAVFILLGQSNAVGHGIPMSEQDKILTPMKNVFGLHRRDNQSFDITRLTWTGYTSHGMNLAEEQDHTYSLANCLAAVWQKEISGGNPHNLPDLYIIQIAIGAQGITEEYMWYPKKERVLISGKLGSVDIALYPFTLHVLSLLDKSFEDKGITYDVMGLHWRGGENDVTAPFSYLQTKLFDLYSTLITDIRKEIKRNVPICFHKFVAPDRMKDLDPDGKQEYLQKMHFINETFQKCSHSFEYVSVFDPTTLPQYLPNVRGNGLFIDDCTHFTPESNKQIARMILSSYIANRKN